MSTKVVFAVACGFAFGWLGVATATVGTFLGILSGWASTRCLGLQRWVNMRMENAPAKVLFLRAAVTEGRRGFVAMCAFRLVFVLTFGLTNALLASTSTVTLPRYLLSSMLGLFPEVVLAVGVGDLQHHVEMAGCV